MAGAGTQDPTPAPVTPVHTAGTGAAQLQAPEGRAQGRACPSLLQEELEVPVSGALGILPCITCALLPRRRCWHDGVCLLLLEFLQLPIGIYAFLPFPLHHRHLPACSVQTLVVMYKAI